MAIQTINIGNSANDGNGEPARSAFNKINQNFANSAHAASRLVGTSAGNVMEVGAFGLGVDVEDAKSYDAGNPNGGSGIGYYGGLKIPCLNFATNSGFIRLVVNKRALTVFSKDGSNIGFIDLLTTANTTTDGNGFIKAASPIVKLFADKIELNNEAAEQNIVFQKIDVGHYLIKGSSGFAQQGWYIETPKDANGNILFAVNYQQLENGDIEVKTYKKKFDIETASIIADLENPIDITEGRWIDIRLQEIPKQIPEYTPQEVNTDEPQQ